MTATATLRHDPNLQEFFLACQDRFPEDDELEVFSGTYPELSARAAAAREVREVEGPIIRKVIKRLFETYPYEKFHDMAVVKSQRDVRLVVTYAVVCMLMGDSHWFAYKLLYWFRTILQSFEFPDALPGKSRCCPEPENLAVLQKLKPHQRSIFECYVMLREEMRKALTPESFAEIEPYLDQAVEILSN